MNTTEAEAREKFCCGPSAAIKCCASDCMAWRWSKTPKLGFTRTLDRIEVESITGNPAPIASDFPASPHEYVASFDRYMRAALEDKSVIAALTHVSKHAEWVADGPPCYDDEEGQLYAVFCRESDPTATGHCGFIQKD